MSAPDADHEAVRHQHGQGSTGGQIDGAPASAGLAAQLAAGRAALQEAQQNPAARRGPLRRTARARAMRPVHGSAPSPSGPPDEPSLAAGIGLHPVAGTALPAAAPCRPGLAVASGSVRYLPGETDVVQLDSALPAPDTAPLAGDGEEEENSGQQAASVDSGDVVELVVGLVERARAAEQDAASARAQLADLTTAITEYTANPAPASLEQDTTGPSTRLGRRAGRPVIVLAGVVAVVTLALAVWSAATHHGDSDTSAPSRTSSPTSTTTVTSDPSPTTTALAEPAGESGAEERVASDHQDEADQAAAEAAAEAERAAQDEQTQSDATRTDTTTTGQSAQQATQQDPPDEPTRASHQQTVSCTATATVTFTASGGGQVDLTAGGQSVTGTASAALSVTAGPGPITATASGDTTVAIAYTWSAPGGTCT